MNDRKIRMVALDLDGTTLNNRGEITPRTISAFHSAMEKQVHIVISTGRTFQSLPKQLFSIEGLEYVVTSNGAHITELSSMKTIYEDHIPAEAVKTIVEMLRSTSISVETFVGGRAYIDQREYEDILAHGSTYRDVLYIKETRNPVPGILDFMMEHENTIENINLNFEFLEEKEKWRQRLSKIEGTTLTSSCLHNFEIGGNGTSKGAALKYLMKKLDVTAEELMAVGDSSNDIQMIRLAGIGVAMSNADEETKAAADWITDSNREDGVAKAIERFVL